MKSYRIRREETPSVKRVNVSITDFVGVDAYSEENTLSLRAAREVANVGVAVGSIVSGAGFSDPELFNGRTLQQPLAKGLHFAQTFVYPIKDLATGKRKDRLLGRNETDGKFYRIELESGEWQTAGGLAITENICGMPLNRQGKDMYMLFKPDKDMYRYNEDSYGWEPCPHLVSVCCQKGRAFGICPDDNRLYFSRLGSFTGWSPDPTSPTGAGFFEMEEDGGRAQEVVAFNGMVFVFKENAIMQLKVYSDVREFQLTKVFQTNGLIYRKTVAVGETAIYFLTDDGLYSFDGYNAIRVFQGVTVIIGDKENSHAAYSGFKYYLATNVAGAGVYGDEADGLTNNAVIVFDMALGSASVCRGVDVLWFTPVAKGKAVAMLTAFRNESRRGIIAKVDESGQLLGVPFKKYWASAETDLSEPARNKIIRRAYISSKYPAEIEFVLDGVGYQYPLYGSPNAQQININRNCRTLKIVFRSEANDIKIRDMTLEVDLVRRYYGEGK